MPNEADYYSPGEAAELLGLTEITVLGLLTSGQLDGQQDEHARWRIPAAVVDEAVRRSKGVDAPVDPSTEETIAMEAVGPAPQEGGEATTTQSDPGDALVGNEADTGAGVHTESGWTTTDVSARALAVSPRTVRRFIDRGELEGRKVREGIVETWEVSIDSLYALRDKREAEGQVRRGGPRVSFERQTTTDVPPDTADYIRELTERLLRLSTEVGELRTRLELTAKTESTLQEVRARLEADLERIREERRQHQDEAERLRAELEAERSKGFWRRLFGG